MNRVLKTARIGKRCVACGCCVQECPRGAVRIFRGITARVDRELCVGCGKCAKLCPVNDISLREGRPTWQGRCIHCMACISACPVQAIGDDGE